MFGTGIAGRESNVAKWTMEEAVEFECARECISHVMAIYFADLYAEQHAAVPNAERIAELEAELHRLGRERSALRGTQKEQIAQALAVYGKIIRDRRAAGDAAAQKA